MLEKIFQVSEFNEFIALYLNQTGELVIEGEISDIKISQGKWLFLTIKDDISSVDIFATTYQIPSYDILETGMLVHVYGIPNLYRKTAKFSVNANRIVPAGSGSIKLAFEKLKQKLDLEGLFAPERKRQINKYPENIGLLTAKGSEAYKDFIKITKNRFGGIKIFFLPILVQGSEAPKDIIRGIKYLNFQYPKLDALVITRGGGSLEDLQAFNDEEVVRAIYGSKIPVISAVGHEGDISLSDLVADLRASTPSNAAELLFQDKRYLLGLLDSNLIRMENLLANKLYMYKKQIIENTNILNHSLSKQIHLLDEIIMNIESYIKLTLGRIDINNSNINQSYFKIYTCFNSKIENSKRDLVYYERLLKSNDYKNILKRGYSISRDKNGNILKSIKGIKSNDVLTSELYDGKIESEVIKLLNEEKRNID